MSACKALSIFLTRPVRVLSAAVLGTMVFIPIIALAQTSGIVIFRGDPAELTNITLADWGSGTISLPSNISAPGSGGPVQINTQGYFQGGAMVFKNPENLAPYAGLSNAYLVLRILIPSSQNNGLGGPGGLQGGPGGYPGGPGGFPGQPGGGFGQGGFPGAAGGGGFGQGGFPGGAGKGGAMGGPGSHRGGASQNYTTRQATLQNLRIELVASDGKHMEALLPLSYAVHTQNYEQLSIPLDTIKGFDSQNSQITQIQLFGDAPGVFLLSNLAVDIDTSPVSFSPIPEQIVGVRQVAIYSANATSGVRPVKYFWDWNAADGLQDESQGAVVQHAYFAKGDYTVTITAVDPFTGKTLGHTTFTVHVHE